VSEMTPGSEPVPEVDELGLTADQWMEAHRIAAADAANRAYAAVRKPTPTRPPSARPRSMLDGPTQCRTATTRAAGAETNLNRRPSRDRRRAWPAPGAGRRPREMGLARS